MSIQFSSPVFNPPPELLRPQPQEPLVTPILPDATSASDVELADLPIDRVGLPAEAAKFNPGDLPVDIDIPGLPSPDSRIQEAEQRRDELEANPPNRADYPNGPIGEALYQGNRIVHERKVDLANKEVEYEKMKTAEPKLQDYQSPLDWAVAKAEYDARKAELQKELGPVYLERYKQDASQASPTARKIIEQAERDGVPVHVLSDEEYNRRYPGTGGITDGGEVYIPMSALESDTGVLEHELSHALIIARNGEIYDENIPLDQRIAHARETFREIGLNPDDGERLVRVTDGWPDNVAADHVQTSVVSVDIAREKAGLPPLTPQQRDELYAVAAEREAALGIQRGPLKDIETKSPQEQRQALAEAERQWASTPQGRANPPSGTTYEERLASLQAILERKADESRLNPFKS